MIIIILRSLIPPGITAGSEAVELGTSEDASSTIPCYSNCRAHPGGRASDVIIAQRSKDHVTAPQTA